MYELLISFNFKLFQTAQAKNLINIFFNNLQTELSCLVGTNHTEPRYKMEEGKPYRQFLVGIVGN
jgi:hypothetical protein